MQYARTLILATMVLLPRQLHCNFVPEPASVSEQIYSDVKSIIRLSGALLATYIVSQQLDKKRSISFLNEFTKRLESVQKNGDEVETMLNTYAPFVISMLKTWASQADKDMVYEKSLIASLCLLTFIATRMGLTLVV